MTRARSGDRDEAPGPIDLTAIRRTAEIIDAVAERRAARSTSPRAAHEGDDPAVHLLQALVADVDHGAPPLCAPAAQARTRRARTGQLGMPRGGRRRSRRRGAHVLIALSVTATMFTTTGVATAGGMISRVERDADTKKSSGLLAGAKGGRRGAIQPEGTGHAVGYIAVAPDDRPAGEGAGAGRAEPDPAARTGATATESPRPREDGGKPPPDSPEEGPVSPEEPDDSSGSGGGTGGGSGEQVQEDGPLAPGDQQEQPADPAGGQQDAAGAASTSGLRAGEPGATASV